MNLFKKCTALFFILLLSAFLIFFIYSFLSPARFRPLYYLGSVQLPDDNSFHFTNSGIAVSLPHTLFYSPDGIEIEPPFTMEDFISLPLGFSISGSTDNYFIISDRYIFSTYESPFEKVWESPDHLIWDVFELDSSLLLILQDENNKLIPYLLDLETDELKLIEGLHGTHYLGAAVCNLSNTFSLMTLSDDGLFTTTRVFHFDSSGSLTGGLFKYEELFFNLHRLNSNFILVGQNNLICYNTDGTLLWTLEIPDAYRSSSVFAGDYLWLYFQSSAGNFSNALRVNVDASKEWFNLPQGLSSFKALSDGFAGVLDQSEILVFNDSGNVLAKHYPEVAIEQMFFDSDLRKHIFLLDRFGRLNAFTYKRPAN